MSDPPARHATRDEAARLLRGAVRRRAVAVDDLRLPETLRLRERDRFTARTLLDRVLRTIEDELRAALSTDFVAQDALHAALSSAHVEIAGPVLSGAGASADPELVDVVMRRLEEHRLYLAAHGGHEWLSILIADSDPSIAAGAMAVLVAFSRRLDRFQDPVLARTELPAELQHRLVWTVAAALRSYLINQHDVAPAAADAALGRAATEILAGYDEGDSLEARCDRLTHHLHAAGRLDSAAVAASLGAGLLPLFLAGLSAVTGLGHAAVWDILSDPARLGPVLLLKAAGLDRQQAAQTLLVLSEQVQDDIVIEQVQNFDLLGQRPPMDELSLWLLDPAYRDAVLRLGTSEASA